MQFFICPADLFGPPLGELLLERLDGGPRVVEFLCEESDGRVAVVDVAAEGAQLFLRVCLLLLRKSRINSVQIFAVILK